MRRASIVLCGGKSTRMKSDKASLLLEGVPMLRSVVDATIPAVERVVVVAAPEQFLPRLPPQVSIARDDLPGQGPLAGFATGLRHVQGFDVVFLASCDIPYLQTNLVRFLFDSLGDFEAVLPEIDGRMHPLAAVYRVDVGDTVAELLSRSSRRMLDLCDRLNARRLCREDLLKADASFRSFVNINTPEDYHRATSSQP